MPLRDGGSRHVEGGIGDAAHFPGRAPEEVFEPLLGAGGRGLQPQALAVAAEREPLGLEVRGGQAAQGSGVGNGNLDGIDLQAEVTDVGVEIGALHICLRPAAGGQQDERA